MSRKAKYDTTGRTYEDARYGTSHMQFYRECRNEILSRIIRESCGDEPLEILEVGCGTGLTLQHLAHAPVRHRLCGVDFSRTMLRQGIEKAIREGYLHRVEFAIGNALRLPFPDDRFHIVYSTRLLHQFHREDKRRLLREFTRVARRGGIVVSEFYARPYHLARFFLGGRKGRSWDSYFSHYPTAEEVRDVVRSSFARTPIRLAGTRLLHGILGEKLLKRLTAWANTPPLSLLMDEYFVTARK